MSDRENYKLLIDACAKGNIELAKSLFENGTRVLDSRALGYACQNGHIDIVKWLYYVSNIHTGFAVACSAGHLNIAQWIYSYRTPIDGKCAFLEACINGHLDVAKWLRSRGFFDKRACLLACERGHLHIAQWLYYKTYRLKKPFILACQNGHINIAQWIYSLHPEYKTNEVFLMVCDRGHLEMAKWMYTDKYCIKHAFRNACKLGKSTMDLQFRDCKFRQKISRI